MTTPSSPKAPGRCAACGAPVRGRFCPQCGTPAGAAGPRSPGDRTAWIAAAAVIALSAVAIVYALSRPATPAGGPAVASGGSFAGPAPDISTLTPRESFDRLFNRVMMAAEQNDTATVIRFTEHALSAYTQLEAVDEDARYHAAVLNAQTGRYPEALALADTILASSPGHLLGIVIRGTVAELTGDQPTLAAARRDFLAAWAADPKRDRPEYLDHQPVLDQFRAAAEAAPGR